MSNNKSERVQGVGGINPPEMYEQRNEYAFQDDLPYLQYPAELIEVKPPAWVPVLLALYAVQMGVQIWILYLLLVQ